MTISGPIAIAGISLILVVKLSVNCQPMGSGMFFSGTKQPINLVINSEFGRKAFDIRGAEVQVSTLVEQAPDLAVLLGKS